VSLEVEARLQLGTLDLDVSLEVADGETVALLGPNGSGKSTILRIVAGLQPLDEGRVVLDGTVLDDPAAGVLVAPERRRVGMVFQDYLLFDRLTARDNVAFGLRARKVGRDEARRRAADWLGRVGLTQVAGLRARALSGGQQQRVALARALATEPRLLLLDEPLAALDAATRNDIRRELRRHLAAHDGPRVLVTHDPVDAHTLADRVVVLEAGRVTQIDTPAGLTAHPRSAYVGELVGVNLFEGILDGTALVLPGGARLVVAPPDDATGPTLAVVHPHAVSLHRDRPSGSPRNCWAATVAELDRHADRVRVRLDGPLPLTAEITPSALAELALQPGAAVWATLKATEITTYPA